MEYITDLVLKGLIDKLLNLGPAKIPLIVGILGALVFFIAMFRLKIQTKRCWAGAGIFMIAIWIIMVGVSTASFLIIRIFKELSVTSLTQIPGAVAQCFNVFIVCGAIGGFLFLIGLISFRRQYKKIERVDS